MKRTYLLPLVIAAGVVAGCHSTGSSSTAPATSSAASAVSQSLGSLNTAQLVDAFKNADADTLKMVQDVVTSVGKHDWSGAIGQLQKIQKIPGLTGAQEESVKSLLGSLNAKR